MKNRFLLLTCAIFTADVIPSGHAFVPIIISKGISSSTCTRKVTNPSSCLQVASSTRHNRRGSNYDRFNDDDDDDDDYDDNFSHNEGREYYRPRQDSSNEWDNNNVGSNDSRNRNGYNRNNNRNNNNNRRGERGNNSDRRGNNPRRDGARNSDENNRGNNNFDRPSRAPSMMEEKEVDITDTNAHFFSKKSLTDPSLQMKSSLFEDLCRGAGITRPSRIQSLAWPVLSTGKHTIVADQTGSGKTLAYLLPLLKRALEAPREKKKQYGAPRVLILAPTAELADQIRGVCAKISEQVPFNTMVVTANGKYTTSIRDQIRMIQRQPIDVLISTPGRVSTILRTRNSGLDLTELQTIVLDEVDILLIDDTFGPQLRTVGEAAPALEKTQFVFVTATLPDSIVETVQEEFPDVVQVRGPGLHRTAPSLKETLVDVSVPAEFNRDAAMCFDVKAKQLLRALRNNKCRRTLIFCNTVESCRDVENLLNRKDRRGQVYHVAAYHNAMTPEARNANLRDFARGDDNVDSLLICTDRAARGVDFDAAAVDHVIVFDFPKDPAEYVRRVGRTARAGRTGTCTVFAHGWQLPIARNVMGTSASKVNFKIAVNDIAADADDDSEYEFPKKHKKREKSKGAIIREKIESGRLWEDK